MSRPVKVLWVRGERTQKSMQKEYNPLPFKKRIFRNGQPVRDDEDQFIMERIYGARFTFRCNGLCTCYRAFAWQLLV